MSAPTSPVSLRTSGTQPESQASSSSAASPPAHNPRCAQHPPIPTLFEPPTVPPPSYSASMSSLPNLGFPPGYFLIRSVANGRALDVAQNETKDGSEVICWPEKEYSLVETLRNPLSDNQVFYIDGYGALCSRESGHTIDVQNGKLVLRHRRPVTYPYPNAYSHPLPQFSYNPRTGVISVSFSCDPSFPHITRENAQHLDNSWRRKTYVLATLPERRQKTFVEDASEAIVGVLANPFGFVGGLTASLSGGTGPSNSQEGRTSSSSEADFDLHDDEVVEEERADAEEVDDSPELLRQVRVLAVDDANALLHPKTRDRRMWEVVPLRTSKAGWTR